MKGRKQSTEQIASRVAKMTGRKTSEETKLKISESLKVTYRDKTRTTWYGKHLSEEHKKKCSLAKLYLNN